MSVTYEVLKNLYQYDADYGLVVGRKNMEPVGLSGSINTTINGKRVHLQAGRLAAMLWLKRDLEDGEVVDYKDGNSKNLTASNLLIRGKGKKNYEGISYLATDEAHIYYGTHNELFVVRIEDRAAFRTYNKREAIKVRDLMLGDPTAHFLDKTTPSWFRNLVKKQNTTLFVVI